MWEKIEMFEQRKFKQCPFCERVAGRDNVALIKQTDHFSAFLNPRQFEKGQATIVTNRHAETLLDLTKEEQSEVYSLVQEIAAAQTKALGCDGITIYQNNGWAAGQEVPHFHLHVVPRHHGGGSWGAGPPPIEVLENVDKLDEQASAKTESQEKLTETSNLIKAHLKA